VNDFNPRVVRVNAAITQINKHLLGLLADTLQQNLGLLKLRRQNMTVVRIPGECARTNDQSAPMGDRKACFDAKFLGLPRFSFVDAFHFRGVHRVQLVLVLRLLAAQTLSPLEYQLQPKHCGRTGIESGHLALHLTHHNPQHRALPLKHTLQAPD